MATLDPTQAHLAKDLIGQVVRALVAENSLLRDDSTRIKRLITEAARTTERGAKARVMRVDAKKAREESVMAVMERNIT